MPTYALVVHAPPDRTWPVLLDAPRRATWKNVCTEAAWGTGNPGTVGSLAQYATKSRRWTEMLIEVEAERRARFEVRTSDSDEPEGWLEWRLQPISLGSLLVLEVRGKNPLHTRWIKYARGLWLRRLLRSAKVAAEAQAPPAEAPVAAPPPEEEPASARKPRKRSAK